MADKVVAASLQLNAEQANQSVKSFKQELRDAQKDLLNVSARFGDTSKEAVNAAKRVAELRDRIADTNSLVNAFNPDRKFIAVGQAVQGITGGFSALQGVMGLVGVESENVQKQLLKVQSALALTQGLDAVRDSVQGFKNLAAVIGTQLVQAFSTLRGAILTSGIGALAVGLTVLIVKLTETTAAQEAMNDAVEAGEKEVAGFNAKLTEVEVTFKLARAGAISKKDALKEYNEKLGDSIGFARTFAEAEKNLVDNTAGVVEALKLRTQATVLFRRAAEEQAKVVTGEAGEIGFFDALGAAARSVFGGTSKFVEEVADKVQENIKDTKDLADTLNKEAEKLLTQAVAIEQKLTIRKRPEEEKKKAPDFKTEVPKLEDDPAVLAEVEKFNFLEGLKDKSIINDKLRTEQEKTLTDARIAYAELERQAKVQAARDIGGALGALADLVGRQTVAGKALAIAQATINTWTGATEVLRSKSTLPEPFATISKIANVAAIVATGLSAIKNIVKTQVPGGGGGGGAPSTATLAPLVATPQQGGTQLNAGQIQNQGNAAVQAFVLETDISSNRERITRLNRAARLTG